MNDNEIGQNSAQITINTANITKNAFDIAYYNAPEGKWFCFVDRDYIFFVNLRGYSFMSNSLK